MNEDTELVLVIDDEKNMCHMLQTILENAGYRVETATHGKAGLEKITARPYDFVLCDLKMPGMDGIELLKNIPDRTGSTCVIMMSAYGTIDKAVEAVKLGAFDFISKPFKPDEILLALRKGKEKKALQNENRRLKKRLSDIEDRHRFQNIKAKSKAMQTIFELLDKIVKYDTTVLITGESGTGKELIARAIYFHSDRKEQTLVPVNCGGIPEALLESELFGHKKGAFTGADKNKKGLFEEANKGIIFLDEIGEMPLSLQVKLLRVLQENEIRPLGDSGSKTVDVRIIAATSKNLRQEVAAGRFREDLFYRLNVMPVSLPPLRDRTDDIPLLCDFFIKKFNEKFGKKVKRISSDAMNRLLFYHWPGNVRELENTMERAVILTEDPVISPEVLHMEYSQENTPGFGENENPDESGGHSLKAAKERLEKKYIIRALKETNGNRTQTSKLLGISHPSLLSKMKQYGISDPPA